MINYFGIGLDGEISQAFEKKRTSYRCCNKLVYGWEGAKRILCCCCCCCCCATVPLNKQISYIKVITKENNTLSRINDTVDSLN
jgi:hypothetical protein